MDGNGRWATRRGLPRTSGHRAGAKAIRRTVEAAPALGVDVLTLYAFSCDNWGRPAAEVNALLSLLAQFLDREIDRSIQEGVRVSFIGRRDRLPESLQSAMRHAELRTLAGSRMWLRIAIDYSSRDAILEAAGKADDLTRTEFSRILGGAPDVDLLIRTGGEQRLSDFLLWECAYAELLFLDAMWPDFCGADLDRALLWYQGRERRFGRLPKAV